MKSITTGFPILLLGLTIANINQAFAWGWNGGGPYESAYNAGTADAVYDHQNGLAYNPVGSCLPCHSPQYWNNFHQGYDAQWNTYQEQTIYVNIHGNGNEVYLNQRQDSGDGPWNIQQPQGGWNNQPGQQPDP
ncbi:MAG: hypothetical protein WA364_01650 [Candidatus Nitrosopolaris sp.]